jgi:hypothetical protein
MLCIHGKAVLYAFYKQSTEYRLVQLLKKNTMTVSAACVMINTEDLSSELSRVIFTLNLIQALTKLAGKL